MQTIGAPTVPKSLENTELDSPDPQTNLVFDNVRVHTTSDLTKFRRGLRQRFWGKKVCITDSEAPTCDIHIY